MSHHNINISKKLLSKTETLLLHGVGFVTGDPTIKFGFPYVFHPGMQIRVTEPGDSKWIYMMLPVLSGSLITNIRIAYHRVGIENRILFVRLVEQREPISATVVHDEKLDPEMPSTGLIDSSCRILVNKSLLLKICIDIQNIDDMVEFGSIEISYTPAFKEITGLKRKRLKLENDNKNNGLQLSKDTSSSLSELILTKLNKKNF